jgi:chromosome segregation ATPase
MPASDELRQAHEELSRRVALERLAFADRVQEALDDAQRLQGEIELRDRQIETLQQNAQELQAEAARLQARIESLHAELIEAHRNYEGLERSRSFRYTAPFRTLAGAVRRRQA